MIKLGLLGFGTVGQGAYEILNNRKNALKQVIGDEITITRILVRNLEKVSSMDIGDCQLTNDFQDILTDPEISIIIEVTGDLEDGYSYIKSAMEAGKHIVTANKSVVSKHFEELNEIAKDNRVSFLYEASVGGGIPILKPLKEEILLNQITEVEGILNGTCNYILSRMVSENVEYDYVLSDAQKMGYAEADPTSDVEGIDSMRKLRILSSLAFQQSIQESDIIYTGISQIKNCDIRFIKEMNATVKLLARSKMLEGGFVSIVEPTIVSNQDYFANVNMAYNSISFVGDHVGELKFYGSGAGKLPTGDAVIRDVVDICLNNHCYIHPPANKEPANLNHLEHGKYLLRVSGNPDVQKAIILILMPNITKSLKCGTFYIFDDICREKLIQFLADRKLGKNDYFLARLSY